MIIHRDTLTGQAPAGGPIVEAAHHANRAELERIAGRLTRAGWTSLAFHDCAACVAQRTTAPTAA